MVLWESDTKLRGFYANQKNFYRVTGDILSKLEKNKFGGSSELIEVVCAVKRHEVVKKGKNEEPICKFT